PPDHQPESQGEVARMRKRMILGPAPEGRQGRRGLGIDLDKSLSRRASDTLVFILEGLGQDRQHFSAPAQAVKIPRCLHPNESVFVTKRGYEGRWRYRGLVQAPQ